MTEHDTYPQEWHRLAWAIGADHQATNEPGRPDTDRMEARAFRTWAERVHGPTARRHIATHDALMTIRFGPETSPDRLTSTAPDAQQFARDVQTLIDAHDDDWEIRDDQIVSLAIRFAGQYLPGGIQFPATDQFTRCAVAAPSPNETGRYAVLLLDRGQIGGQAMDDDFGTLEQAQQAAEQWNAGNGVTRQRVDEILAGPRGLLFAGPIRIESVP